MKAVPFLLLVFFSCKDNTLSIYLDPTSLLVDSLIIEDPQSLSEFLAVEFQNDSTLKTYNIENSSVTYYKKGTNNTYKYGTSTNLPTKGYLPVLFWHNKNYFLGFSKDSSSSNILYKYDSSFNLIKSTKFNYEFDYLQNNFSLSNNITSPIISKGDTLISVLYHHNAKYLPEYYNENSLVEFIFRNDTIHSAKTFISKPSNLDRYSLRATTYCFNKNTIYLIYPMMDSICSYNRSTQTESYIPIYNRDFIKPNFSNNELGDEKYFKKASDYELNNFRYGAIFFNKITNHYVIFYYLPIANKNNDKQSTFRDQKEYAIILNEKFEIIEYLKFNHKFFNQANYFFYPGKGLAMPVFKSKSDYENIKYYIYNF